MDQHLEFRAGVLRECGASASETQELLAYNSNVFDHAGVAELKFPLPDESFVGPWRSYAKEVAEAGTISVLAKYLVQLRFPVRAGISQDAEYLAASTRGSGFGADNVLRLHLQAPEKCRIVLHSTPAGHIPLVIAEERQDFVALVRALARRNEPVPIPASMGACMVAGYNNWDRVFQTLERDGAGSRLDPSSYRDRFIILSRGYYSGVAPAEIGLTEGDWRELSFAIRREHECMHYFTRRVFASMRNYLLDEILADYCSIVAAAGRFMSGWMLRFFGLEDFPAYRSGARLENYKGKPELSAGAFVVLQALVKQAADNLGRVKYSLPSAMPEGPAFPLRMLLALSTFTLEELASSDGVGLVHAELARQEQAGIGLGRNSMDDSRYDEHGTPRRQGSVSQERI